MFGIWRIMLAIEVVIYHLAGVPVIGEYAVFGFFVLSGFLMTAIMHGAYGYSRGGLVRYLQNRALRLYPDYIVALMVSLGVIMLLGATPVLAFNPNIAVPDTAPAWIENLTMIFLGWYPQEHTPRLVPPAWALTVEIVYYILIGLGLSRTRTMTLIWLIASATYVLMAIGNGGGGARLYGSIAAGSLPFAIGALTWHFRSELRLLTVRYGVASPVILIPARWLSCMVFTYGNSFTGQGWLITFGNYVNICISALIVCALAHANPSRRWRRIDQKVGDLSYPVYLLHWQCGAVASAILFGNMIHGRSAEGAAVAALGLVLTLVASLGCARLIDPAVERIRSRIRQRAAVVMEAAV